MNTIEESLLVTHSLQNISQYMKNQGKSQSCRLQYLEVSQWVKKQLRKVQANQSYSEPNSFESINKKKKILICMYLEIVRISKQQCEQKGNLLQEMLNFTLGLLNSHQKCYDQLSCGQIKNFRDSISDIEKQYKNQNNRLKVELDELQKDKQHRWRNIYMVVKDNRVLRRQKGRLFKKFKQEVRKNKQLSQDIISLRSQNQKYRLILQEQKSKDQQIKTYISQQLILLKLDKKIKQYPGYAKKILKNQLLNCQIDQLKTFQQKIQFILHNIDQNNQICQQYDDWDDIAEPTKLFYNASIQTYIDKHEIGTNTVNNTPPPKTYCSYKSQTKVRDLLSERIITRVIEMKVSGCGKKQGSLERKKTPEGSLTSSKIKRRGSIPNVMQYNSDRAEISQSKRFKELRFSRIRLEIESELVKVKIEGKKRKLKQEKIEELQVSAKQIQKQWQQKEKKQEVSRSKKKINTKSIVMQKLDFNKNKYEPAQKDKLCQKNKKIFHCPQVIQFKVQYANQQNINLQGQELVMMNNKYLEKDQDSIYQGKRTSLCDNGFLKVHDKKQNSDNINIKWEENEAECFSIKNSSKNLNQNELNIKNEVKLKAGISEGKRKRKGQFLTLEQINSNRESNKQLGLDEFLVKKQLQVEKISKLNKAGRHLRQKTQNLATNSEMYHQHKRKNRQKYSIQIKKQLVNNTRFSEIRNNVRISKISNPLSKSNGQNMLLPNLLKEDIKNAHLQVSQFVQQKQINRDSLQLEYKPLIKIHRCLQKLMGTIITKKKEILQTHMPFKQFCFYFFTTNSMGSLKNGKEKKQFLRELYNTKKMEKNDTFQLQYSYLVYLWIDGFQCELFRQDIFILFVIMIDKLHTYGVLSNISDTFFIPKQYGLKIAEYLLSIYFSPFQTQQLLRDKILNLPTCHGSTINMVAIYLYIVNQLESIVFTSEIWKFFKSISCPAASCMTETQIRSFFSIFSLLESQAELFMKKLGRFALKSLPIFKLCLFSYRFEWKNAYNIHSWIQKKYGLYLNQMKAVKCRNESFDIQCQELEKKLLQPKIEVIGKILRVGLYRHRELGQRINLSFFKFCKLTAILTHVENSGIFSQNLEIFRDANKRVIGKPGLD